MNRDGVRESAAAILLDEDGRLLMQLRDDVSDIREPGKIGLFGGRREGDESFLECIVREIHEELGYYLPPERFEHLARWSGPDHAAPEGSISRRALSRARSACWEADRRRRHLEDCGGR